MKFIHTADWQIGARFARFGQQAEALRAARIRTLRRALEHAVSVDADFLLIGGDLFEDDQIAPTVVREVFDTLSAFAKIPIFILPGNHDPFTGPGCIWARAPFSSPPPHLRLCTAPAAHDVPGGVLLVNPLTQKKSALDPSRVLANLAAGFPTDTIRLGLTHGSPDIGSHIPRDDFPIALDAASRAGLDFLGLGHWHSARLFDGGRMLMPGAPEPTDFSEQGAGNIHEIEIERAGTLPRITAVPIAELRWREWSFDFQDVEAERIRFAAALAEIEPSRTVARVRLVGAASPIEVDGEMAALRERLVSCMVADVRDETSPAFSAGELDAMRAAHPMLGEVIDVLRAGSLPAAELAGLSRATEIPVECLDEKLFFRAQRLLLRALREVGDAT